MNGLTHLGIYRQDGKHAVYYDTKNKEFLLRNCHGSANWVSSGGKYKTIRPTQEETEKAKTMGLIGENVR